VKVEQGCCVVRMGADLEIGDALALEMFVKEEDLEALDFQRGAWGIAIGVVREV